MRARRSVRSLQETLTTLHEHFCQTTCDGGRSAEYRRGHRAGLSYARLCVLDELATDAAMGGARIENPHRGWEEVVLAAIAQRLGLEYDTCRAPSGDQFGAGYRAGVEVARNYTTLVRETFVLSDQLSQAVR